MMHSEKTIIVKLYQTILKNYGVNVFESIK